jgi:hypothetical protein
MEGVRRMNEKQTQIFESALLLNEKRDIKDQVKNQINATLGAKAKSTQLTKAIEQVKKYHKMNDDELYINKNKILKAAIFLMRMVLQYKAFMILLNLNFVSLLVNRIMDLALMRGDLELVKNDTRQYVQLLKSMESEAKNQKEKDKIRKSIEKLEKQLKEESSFL